MHAMGAMAGAMKGPYGSVRGGKLGVGESSFAPKHLTTRGNHVK